MTQVPQHVKDRINAVVAECVKKAEQHFRRTYHVPRVLYNVKGRTGGHASGTDLINMNPILLMENLEEYYKQVVPHEVAHCIDTANGDNARPTWSAFSTRRPKRSIHGPSWQHIMRVFGLQPDRCHNMDTTNAQVRVKAKFEYKCSKCDKRYFVSSVRHNKQQRYAMANAGLSMYFCVKCGRSHGGLVFVGNHGKVSFQEAKQKAAMALAPVVKPPVQTSTFQVLKPKPVPQGNIAVAKEIMAHYGFTLTRQQFIVRAVGRGMKATTASIYYAQLKRGRYEEVPCTGSTAAPHHPGNG